MLLKTARLQSTFIICPGKGRSRHWRSGFQEIFKLNSLFAQMRPAQAAIIFDISTVRLPVFIDALPSASEPLFHLVSNPPGKSWKRLISLFPELLQIFSLQGKGMPTHTLALATMVELGLALLPTRFKGWP